MRCAVVYSLMLTVLVNSAFGLQREPSSVTGRVVTPDGKPAANATVWLVAHRWGQEKPLVESTTKTDANGQFRLTFTPPLRVYAAYVIAHHTAFSVGWQWFDPREIKPLTIRLNRPALLGGVVVTPDGQPLPKARVQVIRVSASTPSLLFQPKSQPDIFIDADDMPEEVTPFWATSDELGRFVFRHLPVGVNVTLVAHHPDFSPAIYPPPGEWFPLRTSQTNLIITVMPKTLLTGLVLREGEPVAKARVICRTLWEGGRELSSLTDETGRFEIALPNSDSERQLWIVWAIAEGGQWQTKPVSLTLGLGSKRSITLNLARAYEVRGVVKDAKTKQPVPFAEVSASQVLKIRGIQAEEIQPRWDTEGVKADEQGNFRLFLLPGEWNLNAWASYKPGHYAFAGTKVVVKDETVLLTDLLLRTHEGRTLTVQVVDAKGKAVANAFVASEFVIGQRTDKSGQATVPFPAATAGSGETEIVFPIWAATSDLRAFGVVTPKPTDKSVRIVVRPGVPVNGQVVDEKGKPVANARVLLQILQPEKVFLGGTGERPKNLFEVRTDAHGRFRCFVPPYQPFQLVASAPNFPPTQTNRLIAQSGKPLQVSIKMLRPDTTFEGVVVDAETGKPVVGAIVLVAHQGAWDWDADRVLFTFTDFNGRFRLGGIRKDHLDIVKIMHPLFAPIEILRPKVLPQERIALERVRPSLAAELEQGKPAPPLSDVRWLDGGPPSFQGATTYLLFATPYEPNCEQILQWLKREYEDQQGKVQVVVVFDASLPPEELHHYVRELNLPFHIGIVPQGRKNGWDSETFQRYGVTAVPKLVVINEQGFVKSIDPSMK